MPLPFLIAGLAAIGSALGGAAVAGGAAAAGLAAAGTAAVAGAAAAGTAAAAGLAAAGTAAVAGAAAAGTAAVAGLAAAGTTVAAVVSAVPVVGTALGAVGTGVGAAATAGSAIPGIVGTTLTAIGTVTTTTAGAAGVGLIATSATIGVATGASGMAKIGEASDLKEAAVARYERKHTALKKVQKNTNRTLEHLGKQKLDAWNSLQEFVALWEQILNKPEITGSASQEQIGFGAGELNEIHYLALSVKDVLKGGAVAISSGSLIGLAAQTSVCGLVTAASTGTAMTSLSGAAAANATLAALGGGSLAAGGLGMAGGAMVLQGITFAPMLAVSGIMLNHQGIKSLEAAKEIESEVDRALPKMNEAISYLQQLESLGACVNLELKRLQEIYQATLSSATILVAKSDNYKSYTGSEKRLLEQLCLYVKLIKELSMQNLLDPKNNQKILSDEVNSCLTDINRKSEQLEPEMFET